VSRLHCQITTLSGTVAATPSNWEGLEVVVPLNDSRTAKVRISIFDGAANEIRPLDRMMKVYYMDRLVFWGVIVKPVWDVAAGTIEVNCVDPTFRLKHRYHRYGDAAVDIGYSLDGPGMRTLIESAIVTPEQLADNVPPLGILWGFDHTTHQRRKPDDLQNPVEGDGLWSIAQRGDNIWDSIMALNQGVVGPDFEFAPLDNLGAWNHVRLNTADKIGNNRTASVVYRYGSGGNLENFVYEPDGDSVRNYMVTVQPGGERNRSLEEIHRHKALAFNMQSVRKYGYIQGWESTGALDNHDVLVAKSDAWVDNYAFPAKFCTITPKINTGPPWFHTHYWVGDIIRVQATRGSLSVNTTARITGVTVSQVDAAGNTREAITCVPETTGAIGNVE
jgi:hypothetical protein